jgi:hypothetical protein
MPVPSKIGQIRASRQEVRMTRDEELKLLIDEQYRDMRYGNTQWPESEVVRSLNAVLLNDPSFTYLDLFDQDGRLHGFTGFTSRR